MAAWPAIRYLVNKCIQELRPIAEEITTAFAIPDRVLAAPIAFDPLPSAGSRPSGNKPNRPVGDRPAQGPRPAKTGGRPPRTGESKSAKPRAAGARGKPAAARGDDWQPRGASAHESHLGVVGGKGRNFRP